MRKKWPKGIYIESSILYKLPLDIFNAEMEQLQKLCNDLGASIFIPEISFKEWLPGRRDAVEKHLSRINETSSKLSKVFNYIQKVDWGKEKEEILKELEDITLKIMSDKSIAIAKTPQIDLNKLIDMAIAKTKPFEETGEKGFRDSINLQYRNFLLQDI